MKDTAPAIYRWLTSVLIIQPRVCIESLAIVHGKAWAFDSVDLATSIEAPARYAVPQRCFCNAYLYSLTRPGLDYCEGMAMPSDKFGLALHHAWAVDRATGKVIDPTWAQNLSGFLPGAEYIGIVLPYHVARQADKEMRVSGGAALLASKAALRHLGASFRRGRLSQAWKARIIKEAVAAAPEIAHCAKSLRRATKNNSIFSCNRSRMI